MIRRHLRQGGTSLKTAPAAVVLGQKTGTQPDKPQYRCFWSTLFPKAHLTKNQVDEAARGHPREWWLQGKNNSILVQSWNEQLRWAAQSSWNPPKIYGRPVETLSSNKNSQSYWELPTPASKTKILHRKLEENWSGLPTHIVPTCPQDETKILAFSSVEGSGSIQPTD